MSIFVSEAEFSDMVGNALAGIERPDFVVGPGRSGAIAAVYASYRLKCPFVPYGDGTAGDSVLIVDTVSMSGRTLRKACKRYERMGFHVRFVTIVPQNETRHHFWFEYDGS